jgi:glycosyltransferase involved in cell wall biosynthesis
MTRLLLVQENAVAGGITRVTDQLSEDLTALGWTITAIRLNDGPIWKQFLHAIRLAKQQDIMLATHNFLPAYITWAVAAITGKPWIMWVHGPILPVLELAQASPAKRRFLSWFYRRVPTVISCSHSVQAAFKDYVKHPNKGQKYHVVPNATSADFITAASCANPVQKGQTQGLTTIRIGFVGRLAAQKRPLQLIELLKNLPFHIQLHVIGDGPLMLDMKEQGLDLIKQKRLHLHGHQKVNASTFHAWQASVLCSAYEGYPMTALESLASGTPCVSTPIEPMQELLAQHAPYMLAKDHSPAALAQALMTTLSTDSTQRQRAMACITQAHTPEKFAQNWSQLLQAAIIDDRKAGQKL